MSRTFGEGSGRRPEIQAWLGALFDESPIAIGFSRDGVMLDANPAYLRLFGYATVEEIAGRSILEQIAPSHRQRIAEFVALRARGGAPPGRYETRGVRKDGSEFPFGVTTTRVVLDDGPLTIAFIEDLTERDVAVAALSASEERFRALSAAASEGVVMHAEGKVVVTNEVAAAMCGFDSAAAAVGHSILELTAPESREGVLNHILSASTEPYEALAQRNDGSTFYAEVLGRTLVHQGRSARAVVIRDITERKRVEAEQRALAERMRHAQKLESLGVLAGGIAHDFNNILTVITNGVALVRRDPHLGEASVTHLETIALAAQRAADLCKQMLAYAGKAALVQESLDLSVLVAEMSSMLEVSLAKKIVLERVLDPEVPTILGDPTQIRQVVMNLVLNASEAIGDARGRVRVTTTTGLFGEGELARSVAGGEPKAGSYVVLGVEDDGAGMDAATVAQMFDPFFTTKFVGRGLGMAAVLGIVRGHAGAIDVDSAPGRGTRIRIFFPAGSAAATSKAPREPVELAGHGVILVVDDERGVRASTEVLLRGLGYEVLVAGDGVDAIDVFKRESHRIGAVLLDLTMPRMGGVETLRELRRIAPGVPVILTSGYGATRVVPSGGEATPDAMLAKPYTTEQILTTLRRVMRT